MLTRPTVNSADEYVLWMATPEAGDDLVDDPIVYWHERRAKFPRLSMMALDFLTVQAIDRV